MPFNSNAMKRGFSCNSRLPFPAWCANRVCRKRVSKNLEWYAMAIGLKRIYEPVLPSDGIRILVERLWPRGVSKQDAGVDFWAKEVAPSDQLRRWFSHEPAKWSQFKERYFAELEQRPEAIELLRQRMGDRPVTFVFASRQLRLNNAVALKEFLERP